MKVMLIMPPIWDACNPYLSLPILARVLRSAGHEVILRDLNIEAQDALFSHKFLSICRDRITHYISQYESQNDLLVKNINDYTVAIESLAQLEYVLENVKEAKSIFRDRGNFFLPEKYYWAENVLRLAAQSITYSFVDSRNKVVEVFQGFMTALVQPGVKRMSTWSEIVNYAQNYQGMLSDFFLSREVLDGITNASPQLVSFTVITRSQLLYTLVIARLLKQQSPETKIVVGGGVPTRLINAGEDIRHLLEGISDIDYYIIGPGESALIELIEFIQGERADVNVSNLAYRRNGKLVLNPQSATDEESVCPDFDGLPFGLYFSPTLVLPYLLTRGCYWNQCLFCDHRYMYNSHYYEPPIDVVIDHLSYLSSKYQTNNFYFCDESPRPEYLSLLSQAIVERGLEINWIVNCRFDHKLVKSDFHVLKAAGCRKLRFGYEWGSQYLLDMYQKGIKLNDVQEILKQCKEEDIAVYLYSIVGAPMETKDMTRESLLFLLDHKDSIDSPAFQFDVGVFGIFSTAPLAGRLKEFGVELIERYDDFDSLYSWPGKSLGPELEEEMEHSIHRSFGLKWYPLRYLSHSLLYQIYHKDGPIPNQYKLDPYVEGQGRYYRENWDIGIECKFSQVFRPDELRDLNTSCISKKPGKIPFEVTHIVQPQNASAQFCPALHIQPKKIA